MDVRTDRRYTKEHEWVLAEGDTRVRVGITDYAQDALGDVVFVELPDRGVEVDKGGGMAEVESTKSVAEVYAPIPGTVVEVNEALTQQPELVNSDPYGEGWFVVIEASGPASLDELLDAESYRRLTEE